MDDNIYLNVGETIDIDGIGTVKCVDVINEVINKKISPDICKSCVFITTLCKNIICLNKDRSLYGLDGDAVIFELVD